MKISLSKKSIFINTILVLISLSMTQNVSAQNVAGRVVFAQGAPTATNNTGAQRTLTRGSEIFSGDRLITDNGRLQLNMVDGAFISVQPNSEYQVESYNYSGSPDGTEQASYRLVKGGVRVVTGLIGRQNPGAYKVNTAVATIGIRGTGYNTRICAGDCGGRPDGLYHQTWEGTTIVVNDVDVQEVPTGSGIYVQDIDSQIEVLDQPPAVLAIETSREEVEEEEEETQEVEDQTAVVAVAEQREETGEQIIVTPSRASSIASPTVSSTVFTNFGVLGVHPSADQPREAGVIELNLGTSIFQRSSDGAGIGFLGVETHNDNTEVLTLGTIDIAAVIGGNNPSEVALAQGLLTNAGSALINEFQQNRASSAEFFYNSEIGFGRWTQGNVLVLSETENFIETLTGNQSIHYIFGTDPGNLPTIAGTANYAFLNGTQSTTVSGNTIGQGITSGNILVDFGVSSALLDMNVYHNSINYSVEGPLSIDVMDGFLSGFDVFATGGDCLPCDTFIDASFAGPDSVGFPKYIGLEYDIQATDAITGVGAFQFSTYSPIETSTVLAGFGLLGVRPDTTQPDDVNVFHLNFAEALFQRDSDSQGIALFDLENDGTGTEQVLATIDTAAVLNGDNAAVVSVAEGLLIGVDAALLAEFESNPASSAEFFTNGEIGYGRWTDGNVLAVGSIEGAEVVQLLGNQSVHYLFGTQPPALPSLGGIAKYDFLGGTQSTTVSGSTIGNGVTAGILEVNFLTSDIKLDMTVNHNSVDYFVNGPLEIDPLEGTLTDIVSGVPSVFATGGLCDPSCLTFIEGGFLGPAFEQFPEYAGLEYDIQATDVIMGVAMFEFGGLFPIPVIENAVFLGSKIYNEPISSGYYTNHYFGSETTLIFDNDSNLMGLLGTFEGRDDVYGTQRMVATVNPNFLLGVSNPTTVTEIQSYLDSADGTVLSSYDSQTKASFADFNVNLDTGFGWGRWAEGTVLLVGEDGSGFYKFETLAENESDHIIFGQAPGVLPMSAKATYQFFGGTPSTSLDYLTGIQTLGAGVTSGFIGFDFGSSLGKYNLGLEHQGTDYVVDGLLAFDTYRPSLIESDYSNSRIIIDGIDCVSDCYFHLHGQFAGPDNSGVPNYIGLSYQLEIYDVISQDLSGVAGFEYVSSIGPTTRVQTNSVYTGVSSDYSNLDLNGSRVSLFNGWDAAIFLDNSNRMLGALGSEYFTSLSDVNSIDTTIDTQQAGVYRIVNTIDMQQVLWADNASVLDEVNSLLAAQTSSDQAIILANTTQGSYADIEGLYLGNDMLGWGRWSYSQVVSFDANPSTNVSDQLSDGGNVHFIFGQDPGVIPTIGNATYSFYGGTNSTDLYGDYTTDSMIGHGTINVNFTAQESQIDMTVQHFDTVYDIYGSLFLYPRDGQTLLADERVYASSTDSLSTCFSALCLVDLDGRFIGPAGTDAPKYLGISYNVSNLIMGVGAFALDTYTATSLSTVVPNNMVFISAYPVQGSNNPVDVTRGYNGSAFLDSGELVGMLFDEDLDTSNIIRAVETVDLDKVLGGDDAAAVYEANNLLADADRIGVNSFKEATAAGAIESYYDPVNNIGWGRWTRGAVLSFDDGGDKYPRSMDGDQSTHYIFGQDPGTIATSGTASYSFMESAPSSTSLSGDTIGTGVTAGTISVDFGLSGSGTINMTVDHVNEYTVSGDLIVDSANNEITNRFASSVTATGGMDNCSPSCEAYINGSFFGPSSAGVPGFVGIEYDIYESDIIMGVAGFEITP